MLVLDNTVQCYVQLQVPDTGMVFFSIVELCITRGVKHTKLKC